MLFEVSDEMDQLGTVETVSGVTAEARVAVVIPCFNDGATLEEALASIVEPEPVEVVIVDDGSDDPTTLDLFARLEADGVRILHQENAGLSAARMAGVRATTAPYVASLDADDRFATGALSALADALDANPSIALVWGGVQDFGEKTIREALGRDLDPWLITYVNVLPGGALIRREPLLDAGGWKLASGYEDWELWMSLAEKGRQGVRLPLLAAYYRVRSTRMLTGAQKLHAEIYRDMAARHPTLFAERRTNRRRSTAPRRCKLLLPVVDRLPLSPWTRHRLSRLVFAPSAALKVRFARPLRAVTSRRPPRESRGGRRQRRA